MAVSSVSTVNQSANIQQTEKRQQQPAASVRSNANQDRTADRVTISGGQRSSAPAYAKPTPQKSKPVESSSARTATQPSRDTSAANKAAATHTETQKPAPVTASRNSETRKSVSVKA